MVYSESGEDGQQSTALTKSIIYIFLLSIFNSSYTKCAKTVEVIYSEMGG